MLHGRFSVPAGGFVLFGSADQAAMPGVSLRYIEFYPKVLSNADIRSAQNSSVLSQFRMHQQSMLDDQSSASGQALALKSLYKHPPAVWQELAYVCEFGDACVEGTGLGGATSVYASVRVLAHVARRMWEEQQAGLDALSSGAVEVLGRSVQVCVE